MDANEVIAAAEQAAVSLVDQAAPSSDADGAEGGEVSTKADASSVSTQGPSVNGGVDAGTSPDPARETNKTAGDPIEPSRGKDDNDEEVEEGAYMEEGEVGEMSFVIDTAGDMDVDREIALEDEAKAEHAETHIEDGLLLPTHVNLMFHSDKGPQQPGGSSSGPSRDQTIDLTNDDDEDIEGDMGDFEQLDMDPSTANRYYGAEEKAERRAKEQCLACGELGHDRRHCPHQHCLACGAMDDHPTRFCPMSTSCFRCGGTGHQTRTCPKPRRGPRSEECERCGSYTHVKTLCPTLWRVYTYSTLEDYDRFRAKAFFKLQSGSKARDPRRDLEPDPEELSDSEDEFAKAGEPDLPAASGASQFDPATRWCYNCSTPGNHWGDDCPEPRCNPTRGTNEPSAFSEFVSRLGPFAKMLPGAPPLAGFQMPSSQFTFSVGSSATMHVAGDAVASSSGRSTPNGNTSRRGQSSRDQHGGGGSLAIGRHTISSPRSSRATSPHASSSRSRGGGASSDERLVLLDQAKAIECKGGGFLTRKEKDQGKKPLPEHLFLQWLRDRQAHSEFANKIRKAFEKRAELEAAGKGASHIPTTQQIVAQAKQRKEARKEARKAKADSERPSKKRKGSSSDPIDVDSDSSYRDDFSSDSDSDSDAGRRGGKKRRGDGKNNRSEIRTRSQVHTGWGHNGDAGSSSGGGRGSNGSGGGKNYKGGRFSSKKDAQSKVQERTGGGGGRKKTRRSGGGGGGGGGGGKKGGNAGRSNPNGGGGGGEKVRGGGSKYRGSYF